MKTLEKNTIFRNGSSILPEQKVLKGPTVRHKNSKHQPGSCNWKTFKTYANNLRNNCYSLGISAASYHLRYNLKSFLIPVPKNALPKNCNKQIPLQIKKQGNISVYHKTCDIDQQADIKSL